jgi:hypothetical protein
MRIIRAISIDAAFANMGLASVELHLPINHHGTIELVCKRLLLVQTEGDEKKLVRKSSSDLRRATELSGTLRAFAASEGAEIAFAEVPSGSQSAAAARALGIAVGVLGGCPVPIIEVSPMEVKRAVIANPKIKVSKAYIIDWAAQRWPKAEWLRSQTGKTKGRLIQDNEHLADAMAAVLAGINTPEFKRLVSINYSLPLTNEIPHTDHNRPAPRREPGVRVPLVSVPLVKRPN